MICNFKDITWILEQPLSSLMEFHPRFQAMLAHHTVRRA